jgi:hypothetical protein
LNASSANTRRAIRAELRVRIGGELIIDPIEIVNPLTRLKSIRENQRRAGFAGVLLQEHWIEYRATAESLRREKFLFLTQTEPYDKDDAFHLLVQRVEALLSNENTEWVQSMMKPPTASPSVP